MSDPIVPEGVGPHEGREFDLMRAGQKDVAFFTDWDPPGLDEILAEGFCLLKFRALVHEGKPIFSHILFRPGFEQSAIRLKEMVEEEGTGFVPEREHEIGRILGYTVEEVEAFLAHVTRKRG